MTLRTASKVVAIIAGAGSIASAGYGQYTYTPPVYTPLQAITSDVAYEGMKFSTRSDDQKSASDTDNPAINAAMVLYTPSKSRTRANLQAFADKTRAMDPAQADKMEAFFGSTDVMAAIGSAMQGVGLNRHNAADAFAVYWVAAWQASVGEMPTASTNAYKAVAAQAARGLSQSPEFAAATDAQKQELAEAMMFQAAMIDAAKEEYASDPAQLKALSKAVLQGAKASGLDLDKMTLTEEGFVEGGPRKGADASDAVEGDATRLASNDRGEGKGDTNYALIAAAAGAGLGGMFLFGKAMGRKG